MTSFGLEGKISVVTGAARGIGEAISRTLAKNGASILLVDILEAQVNKVAEELKQEYPGSKFSSIRADLSKRSEIDRIGEHCKNVFSRSPDILVNNAAVCRFTEWLETSDEEYESVLATDLKSVHMLSQCFATVAIEQNRKMSIVNMASFVAYTGHEKMVNCVCPGYTRTPMSEQNTTEEEFNAVSSKTPLRRIGTPEDVANMVLFLASDLASFCTGSCYDVHGGLTL